MCERKLDRASRCPGAFLLLSPSEGPTLMGPDEHLTPFWGKKSKDPSAAPEDYGSRTVRKQGRKSHMCS